MPTNRAKNGVDFDPTAGAENGVRLVPEAKPGSGTRSRRYKLDPSLSLPVAAQSYQEKQMRGSEHLPPTAPPTATTPTPAPEGPEAPLSHYLSPRWPQPQLRCQCGSSCPGQSGSRAPFLAWVLSRPGAMTSLYHRQTRSPSLRTRPRWKALLLTQSRCLTTQNLWPKPRWGLMRVQGADQPGSGLGPYQERGKPHSPCTKGPSPPLFFLNDKQLKVNSCKEDSTIR